MGHNKQNNGLYIIIFLQSVALGGLYVLWNNDFLIWQGNQPNEHKIEAKPTSEKVDVYFVKHDILQKESLLITYKSDHEKISKILAQWTETVWEEKIINQRIGVDFLSIDNATGTLYCSLTKKPFSNQSSTRKKLEMFYGLFKTIDNANINIKYCIILCHNHVFQDDHIDFSFAWPIDLLHNLF